MMSEPYGIGVPVTVHFFNDKPFHGVIVGVSSGESGVYSIRRDSDRDIVEYHYDYIKARVIPAPKFKSGDPVVGLVSRRVGTVLSAGPGITQDGRPLYRVCFEREDGGTMIEVVPEDCLEKPATTPLNVPIRITGLQEIKASLAEALDLAKQLEAALGRIAIAPK